MTPTPARVVSAPADLPSIHGGLFVPTMGALHEGHLALIRHAHHLRATRRLTGPIIVSIFVNPTQFNDPADLRRYPRTLEQDLAGCARAGADAVFVPDVETIYPPAHPVPVPMLPAVARSPGLEDALRPGHFAGVCQVVARLFELVRPRLALFGEKDWQQLAVIRAMVASGVPANLPIEIVGVPTVRDTDDVALSSRNVFLSPAERASAGAIPRALAAAAGAPTPDAAEATMRHLLNAAGFHIEYAVVRHADTLMPLTPNDLASAAPGRSLIAVRLPSVRLIDNAPWPAV